MVIMASQEPSGFKIEEVKTLWSGLFDSITSLNLEGVLRIGNRALGFIGQDISSGIERALEPPEMAGHAIDHRSDVIFLRSVVADGQDLLVRKIGQGALDLRHEPEPAYHVGTLDALDFAGRLPRGHDLAFGLPFADKLLQQLVFLTRSGHFLAGRGALGGSFF